MLSLTSCVSTKDICRCKCKSKKEVIYKMWQPPAPQLEFF